MKYLFFDDMLTPKLITIVYWLALLSIVIGGIGSMFAPFGFSFMNLLRRSASHMRNWPRRRRNFMSSTLCLDIEAADLQLHILKLLKCRQKQSLLQPWKSEKRRDMISFRK